MSKEFFSRLAEIQRTLNAPKNQFNSFGKYKYRSCEDILEGVKPLLNGLFLSISDEIVMVGDRTYVKAIATITDGETSHSASALAREEESKKGMDSAQVTGATSSYARKYCLNGLFGIDDSKDADTDEHKKQTSSENLAKKVSGRAEHESNASTHSKSMQEILSGFTAAIATVNLTDLERFWGKANYQLQGSPQHAKANEVYLIRKKELEGAA